MHRLLYKVRVVYREGVDKLLVYTYSQEEAEIRAIMEGYEVISDNMKDFKRALNDMLDD